MLIFAGNSNRSLGEKVAKQTGSTLSELEIHTFPDNENRVRVIGRVVGKDCIVVQSTGISPNLYYMELFFILDGLKRSGAKSVTLVIPYLGYQRQDHIFRSGESVSLEVIVNLLSELKVDWVISFDLHSLRIEEFFKIHKIRISHLSALSMFADKIRDMKLKNYVLVSPDMGGIRRIKQISKMLGDAPFIALEKNRDLKSGKIKTEKFTGKVEKNAIIIDDVISSGQTLISAAKILKQSGTENTYVMATHGIFSGDAPRNLEESIIKRVIVTDTLEIPKERKFPKLEILSISHLISKTLSE